jgi:hypothetical protein
MKWVCSPQGHKLNFQMKHIKEIKLRFLERLRSLVLISQLNVPITVFHNCEKSVREKFCKDDAEKGAYNIGTKDNTSVEIIVYMFCVHKLYIHSKRKCLYIKLKMVETEMNPCKCKYAY